MVFSTRSVCTVRHPTGRSTFRLPIRSTILGIGANLLLVSFISGCTKPADRPLEALQSPGETAEPSRANSSSSREPEKPEGMIHLDDPLPPTASRRMESPSAGEVPAADPIIAAEEKATPAGRKILETGRKMTLDQCEIVRGGCWDYANAVYNRAGFPPGKRRVVFKGTKKKGPYADIDLFQPGDWLYYVNHWYGRIEHSAIFVDWIDYDQKEALMLSYGGEKRNEPARYMPYDLSNVYYIVRPKSK